MSISRWCIPGGLTAALLLAGCSTVHRVTVDAISNPTKPLGTTYHLEVNDPTGGIETAVHKAAIGNIKDALGARGLYEVPASMKPDMVIEASYGVGHGHVNIVTEQNTNLLLTTGVSGPPSSKAVIVYDKTLELTAHAPTPAGRTPGQTKHGEELWSLKAIITDTKQDISAYLPALASATINYIGENPGREVILPVDEALAKQLLQQRPPAQPEAATPAK